MNPWLAYALGVLTPACTGLVFVLVLWLAGWWARRAPRPGRRVVVTLVGITAESGMLQTPGFRDPLARLDPDYPRPMGTPWRMT